MLKTIFKSIAVVIIIFSLIFTSFAGYVFASNYNNFAHLVESYALIDSFFLWPKDTGVLVDGMINGMVKSLDDRYSTYLDPEKFKKLTEHVGGVYGGIGVYVDFKDDQVSILSPMEGSPSEKAGLKAGDIIVGVDGQDISGMSFTEIVALVKGEPGTDVELTIRRENEEDFNVTITREYIDNPTVYTEVLEENQDIGYLRIARFSETTYESFVKEMNKILKEDIKALIIDLRYNPGGELTSVVNVTGSFIPEGPVLYQINRAGDERIIETSGNVLGIPIAILVDEGTASAAEVMTGALQDNGVAYVIGTQTFGKGIVQTIFPLGNEGGLEITTDKYLTAGKRDIHGKGITPDLIVELPKEGEEMVDTQFRAAIEYLEKELEK